MTPYIPDSLPIQDLDYQLLFSLVGDASAELILNIAEGRDVL